MKAQDVGPTSPTVRAGAVAALPTLVPPTGSPGVPAWVLDRVAPHLPAMVEAFHARLDLHPGLQEVVGRLDRVQVERLERRQVQHLRLLLSPDATPARIVPESRRLGRLNAMVGMQMDWYADATAQHRRQVVAVLAQLADGPDLAAAEAAITDRFMTDLQGALLGYRDDDDAQNRTLQAVLDVAATAGTVSDLAQGVVEVLGQMKGMGLVLFARRGPDDRLAHEFGAGPSFERFAALTEAQPEPPPVTVTPSAATGQGPLGRAWRTGSVQRCHSLRQDATAAPWREVAEVMGWQSSASVPLVDRSGRSRAMLSLQTLLPGFFATSGRAAMLDQVKRVTESALVELESASAMGVTVTGMSQRTRHLRLLADGQVTMLFQPQVSLRTGRLEKLEALGRLRGPDGLVSPAEFLPSLGDDELFVLFDHGLRQALDALCRWQEQGLHTGVSLNLPVSSFDDERYPTLVARLLAETGIEPQRVTLELLESGFVGAGERLRGPSLDAFTRLGVRLAQDDLGAGYSSLLRLRHFAFDDVKIDRSLVDGADDAVGAALAFLKPITVIARSLGLSVVLEGLEHDGLIEAAVQLGVDAGQGYGIARPMPAADVVAWVEGYRLPGDPCRPVTPLGGLAGHVAWEHRVAAGGIAPGEGAAAGTLRCTLTSYLETRDEPDLAAAHLLVHRLALCDLGSAEHRAARDRLGQLVGTRR